MAAEPEPSFSTAPPPQRRKMPKQVIPPNQTVFVSNLSEKLKKDDLKSALYSLYSQFGPILDVNIMKTVKMRGQAFVVFESLTSASEAVRQTQGFLFYNRPIRIAYAKTKSDAVAKRDGTFRPGYRLLNKRTEPTSSGPSHPEVLQDVEPMQRTKRARESTFDIDELNLAADEFFIGAIPLGTTEMSLALTLKQFPGFLSFRFLTSRSSVALQGVAKFETLKDATMAVSGLRSFQLLPGYYLTLIQPSF